MSVTEEGKPLRSFGRLRGRKLRPSRQHLFDTLLPTLLVSGDQGIGDSGETIFPESLFPHPPRSLTLEIGFGDGEHLARQATMHPETGFIGCEPYINGISLLLAEIDDKNLHNIRIFPNDVRDLLNALPEASLDQAYILFPDPWPKSRHHKRRLIQRPLLDALARALKPGASLFVATDHEDYLAWILAQLLSHPRLSWNATRMEDWTTPYDGWQPTRYQRKAIEEGRTATFLRIKNR